MLHGSPTESAALAVITGPIMGITEEVRAVVDPGLALSSLAGTEGTWSSLSAASRKPTCNRLGNPYATHEKRVSTLWAMLRGGRLYTAGSTRTISTP